MSVEEFRYCRRNGCNAALRQGSAKCEECGFWNVGGPTTSRIESTQLLSELPDLKHERLESGPWDPCFGGGIVTTSFTLLAGAPGAGKSTLMMQLASACARGGETLYISLEEAPEELCLRAERLHVHRSFIRVLRSMSGLYESGILDELLEGKGPKDTRAIIIDSFSAAVGDDRQMANVLAKQLKMIAVKKKVPVIAICQITKDESFAGPEFVQHAVDTILALRLSLGTGIRSLYTLKNRFGPAHVSVDFEMRDTGLWEKEKDDEEDEESDDEDDYDN